ncbi:MAG: hypothetical protein IJK07_10285 [Bacteroidales bacterium]|nr:hypothetical protein [Bacteroidales bacterium]
MKNVNRRAESGERRTENGERRTESRLTRSCHWSLFTGHFSQFTILLLAFLPLMSMAQSGAVDTSAAKKTVQKSIKPYGFIRNYFNYDSRKTVTVCGGEYLMIPSDEDWANSGIAVPPNAALPEEWEADYDRNAVPQAHFLALSSRFGIDATGPELFGAKSSAKLEGDFAGFGTTNTVFRLRLAYAKLTWHREYNHSLDNALTVRSELLIGQDWHPLSGNIMPDVLGMAAGAPFRPHSRTPQVRWMFYPTERLGFTAAALYQFQYTSPGPDGESAKYANQSIVPELFVGLNYRDGKFYSQLGIDYSRLTIYNESAFSIPPLPTSFNIRAKRHCNSLSPTFYFQYSGRKLTTKFRTTLAQNLAHLNMLSGYALAFSDEFPDGVYRPLTSSVTYFNIAYGKTWRTNLFLGYQKNLGLPEGYTRVVDLTNIYNYMYMKKGIANINTIYRVAPSISYNTKAFNIGLEYELTAVAYGDLQVDGTVADNDNLRQVVNHRICAMVKYNF